MRTLLLLSNFMILLLPVGGVVLLHLYESELVRQTESALIGQGALLAATYRQEILRSSDNENIAHTNKPIAKNSFLSSKDDLTPIRPKLDVAKEPHHPPAPEGLQPSRPPDPIALIAGRSLEPVLRDAQRITLAGIRLVDHNGVVVASSGSESGLSLINRLEVKGALAGNYVSILRKRVSDEPAPTITSFSRRAWLRVFVALPVIEERRVLGAVVLSRSPIGVGRGLYLMRNHLIKATAIVLILVVLVSLLTTLAITRPIKALIKQADNVRKGEMTSTQPLEKPGTEEVAKLSSAIAQMASSLAARADYIRTFARNVSHEFKTPLSSLKGSVELLQDHSATMPEKEKQNFLKNMANDIDGLDRMVRRLLEMARADVVQQGIASCEIGTVLLEISDHYPTDRFDIKYKETNTKHKINMECDVLKSIFVNLIDNGLQHGGEDNHVTVSVQHSDGRHLEILVSDTGTGISQDNAKRIFRPFFTTARHQGGTGLGLSIVQSLLASHEGTIELLPTSQGTIFRLRVLLQN